MSTLDFDSLTKNDLLIEASRANRPIKVLKQIHKALERFPSKSKQDEVDQVVAKEQVVLLSYKAPVVFVCYRCDKAKLSTFRGNIKTQSINGHLCQLCYEHITRCVIPYRSLPEYQRPEKCMHKIPCDYLKVHRNFVK